MSQEQQREFTVTNGRPLPFGATVRPDGINFSIFSKNASAVTLDLFARGSGEPVGEIRLDSRLNRTGDIWHVAVTGLDHTKILYSYRVDGPWDKEKQHRFDKASRLLDPYARSIAGAERWGGDYARVEYQKGFTRTHSDLRCAIAENGFDWRGDRHPEIPMEDLVIYELHVRGFTRHPSSGAAAPGTFSGLIEKLPYLKKLGVNAIELMPVHEFFESEIERANPVTGERLFNYWGYSTIAFFAPKASYAASGEDGGQVNEFRELVRSCHEHGMEVILDVVFNHTAEGNERGPSLSFRGLDNSVYYMLGPGGKYLNFSGCGNTMNCNHPVVRDMIRECLRYWVTEMHVDGFRFDLASILGRDTSGNPLSSPPLLESIALDPALAHCKLIAEAWDAGGLYQIGTFPAWGRWGEWNGKYRDTARKFLRGDEGQAAELATRISGSPDLYKSGGRFPYHSINFITCHDGFTLRDLFSYNEKRNEANGEEGRDGSDANWSHNHGVEGPSDDPEIEAVRMRQMKNAVLLLMISQGVPMLYEGDEMGRTKNGNNNTYCHDNGLNWIDWGELEKNEGMFRFVAGMIHFRKSHSALTRKTYYTGEKLPGSDVRDIEWFGANGEDPDWDDHGVRTLALMIGDPGRVVGGKEPDIYVAFNAGDEEEVFRLPKVAGRRWRRKVYTALDSPDDFMEAGSEEELADQDLYSLAPKSALVLVSSSY